MIRRPPDPRRARSQAQTVAQQQARTQIEVASNAAAHTEIVAISSNLTAQQFAEERARFDALAERVQGIEDQMPSD